MALEDAGLQQNSSSELLLPGGQGVEAVLIVCQVG